MAPPASVNARVPLTVDGSDPAVAGAMRRARTAIPSTGAISSAEPSAKVILTDATSLPTRTATHHTGSPSATPKAPDDTSCGSDPAGTVVVGVAETVPPGASVVVEEGGDAAGAGVNGTMGSGTVVPVPVEPDPVPVEPDPTGLAGHSEVESAPCPTAVSSESSMLTEDPTGTGPEDGADTVVVVVGATVVVVVGAVVGALAPTPSPAPRARSPTLPASAPRRRGW